MIRYQLNQNYDQTPIFISLSVDDGNSSALLQFEGEAQSVEIAKFELLQQYGAFGHGMEEVTTGYDLSAALNSPGMTRFNPKILEGKEIVGKYDPKIPDGAIT